MILQRNNTFSPRHVTVIVGDFGEDDPVDLLRQGVPLGNDLHRVPAFFVAVSHDLFFGGDLLNRLFPVGRDRDLLPGGRHEMANFLGRVGPEE